MFKHIFIHNFKMLLKNKILIFWMLIFPIVLGLLFKVAFANLSSANDFEKISISVVVETENEQFLNVLKQVSDIDGVSEESDLFIATNDNIDDAKLKLNNKQVTSIIVVSSNLKLIMNNNGIEQSIIKSFIDDYNSTISAIGNVANNSPKNIERALQILAERTKNISASAPGAGAIDSTVIYFYTLIAMVCMFFSLAGSTLMDTLQPCQSLQGARVTLSCIPRVKQFFIAFLAYLAVCIIILAILLIYIIFILRINFSNKWYFIILTAAASTIMGMLFGIFISACVKKKQGLKVALNVAITLTLCFLAGMMMSDIKYLIMQNLPIINMLNPIAAISDCFYSIYYYSNISNFFISLGVIIGYIILFATLSILLIRRKSYASI